MGDGGDINENSSLTPSIRERGQSPSGPGDGCCVRQGQGKRVTFVPHISPLSLQPEAANKADLEVRSACSSESPQLRAGQVLQRRRPVAGGGGLATALTAPPGFPTTDSPTPRVLRLVQTSQ
ncbi:hypothetical protein SKAU_G00139630 [Synaphobranchus kaupii]|uniref:Uncharacterized protein n=1 Tax=Synaphobranchus kaupii TaxID=118154 RepID=A0A9Q1J211_SYNKA|nr:hypothetical protein SKAU_G00139630 [Synaphobranchus kaupii]